MSVKIALFFVLITITPLALAKKCEEVSIECFDFITRPLGIVWTKTCRESPGFKLICVICKLFNTNSSPHKYGVDCTKHYPKARYYRLKNGKSSDLLSTRY